ncbi:hypothetical protein [Magnetococcus sp. PR-3]|uniref:hypothetical protein n=1 Tax=Magnetococcus sp. PR-3 TaxID=3120355 RepID=UPI002FCE18BD
MSYVVPVSAQSGYEYLETIDVLSAEAFIDIDLSQYTDYKAVRLSMHGVSTSGSGYLQLKGSLDGGVSWLSTSSWVTGIGPISAVVLGNQPSSIIRLSNAIGGGVGYIEAIVSCPHDGNASVVATRYAYNDTPGPAASAYSGVGGGAFYSGVVDMLRFQASSGNLIAGRIVVEGVL